MDQISGCEWENYEPYIRTTLSKLSKKFGKSGRQKSDLLKHL